MKKVKLMKLLLPGNSNITAAELPVHCRQTFFNRQPGVDVVPENV